MNDKLKNAQEKMEGYFYIVFYSLSAIFIGAVLVKKLIDYIY